MRRTLSARLFLLFFTLLSLSSWAFNLPQVQFSLLTPLPHEVFLGETQLIKYRMNYKHLKYQQIWFIPPQVTLQIDSGQCPSFGYQTLDWPFENYCDFSIVIQGKQLDTFIDGALRYHLYGQVHHQNWDYSYQLEHFSVRVIPHPLSMREIPLQRATANLSFYLNLQDYVNYYTENTLGGRTITGIVSPQQQDGLYFDAEHFALIGTPSRIGTYLFKIGAKNKDSITALVALTIHVENNSKDKPVFKENVSVASATPDQNYQLDLITLIESQAKFKLSNPLRFRIDQTQPYPEWLHIAPEHPTYLEGIVPVTEAGQLQTISLIASSNTGGDSLPKTIYIPIAADPTQKPIIHFFQLTTSAGADFHTSIAQYINDPTHDNQLKLIIDKIEPKAPWLNVSFTDPLTLEGIVPQETTGRLFQLTIHANTIQGGNSDLIQIPLQVVIDKEKTPYFKVKDPILTALHPGQPFFYDFVAQKDIFPEYETFPYTVRFAEEYSHPNWLKIEKNKLIAEEIPSTVNKNLKIYVKLHNVPGGDSAAIELNLYVAA